MIACMLTAAIVAQASLTPVKPRALWAIGQVESGGKHHAVGKHGERSQYQITRQVWREHTRLPWPPSPRHATQVAEEILSHRIDRFERATGRQPSNTELYLLWHRPSKVSMPSRLALARARRFANVVECSR
jgi:hypothetical protein